MAIGIVFTATFWPTAIQTIAEGRWFAVVAVTIGLLCAIPNVVLMHGFYRLKRGGFRMPRLPTLRGTLDAVINGGVRLVAAFMACLWGAISIALFTFTASVARFIEHYLPGYSWIIYGSVYLFAVGFAWAAMVELRTALRPAKLRTVVDQDAHGGAGFKNEVR
jgi:hypothetical protein